MSIFKKKKVETELEPVASLQIGNYIIKEWGRSASPSGKVYNVPCITVEDAALTWRVSVESSHSRYMLLSTLLHWADVSPDGSAEVPESTLSFAEYVLTITLFTTTEDFMGEKGPDMKFMDDLAKAIKRFGDRRLKEANARQTEEERAAADAEALDEMRHPEKALDEA